MRMSSTSAAGAVYSLVSTVLTIGLVVVLHFLEPEFDPSWRMLSEYSLGRFGVLMRLAFLAGGTAVIGAAIALGDSAWPGSIGLVLVAGGPLGAAFVDTDPITTPRGEMSRRSKVHSALGSLFILGFPVAAAAAGISAANEPEVGSVLAWASVAPWIALIWFIGTSMRYARAGGEGSPEVRVGWPNRVSMLVYVGWVALAAALTLS
jgi:hypothetical protein